MGMFDFFRKENANASSNYRKTGLKTNVSNYGWYRCVHCGKSFRKDSIEIDHIYPRSRGGGNNAENLQCLCRACNRSKGNNMSQTKEDLKQRRNSYGQYKREQVLKPKLQEKRKEIREKYIANLSDQDILEALHNKELEAGWTDLKREARKRGIV